MENYKNMSFDEAMQLLEKKISILEKMGNSVSEKALKEASELKDYCQQLLDKEKAEIIKTARENNIPLEEIGFSDADFTDVSEEDEDEEKK